MVHSPLELSTQQSVSFSPESRRASCSLRTVDTAVCFFFSRKPTCFMLPQNCRPSSLFLFLQKADVVHAPLELSTQQSFLFLFLQKADVVHAPLELSTQQSFLFLFLQKADVALAPFQMSANRSMVVDFTKPFMTKGTTVVVRRPEQRLWIFQFLSPLSRVVWSAIFLSFVVVSLTLFGVSRVNSDRCVSSLILPDTGVYSSFGFDM